MKKLKLFALGIAILALGTFTASYFGASQADANPNPDYCNGTERIA